MEIKSVKEELLDPVGESIEFIKNITYKDESDRLTDAQFKLVQYAVKKLKKGDSEMKEVVFTPDKIAKITGVIITSENKEKWDEEFLTLTRKLFTMQKGGKVITGSMFAMSRISKTGDKYVFVLNPFITTAVLNILEAGEEVPTLSLALANE